jgi:hypothetical protein
VRRRASPNPLVAQSRAGAAEFETGATLRLKAVRLAGRRSPSNRRLLTCGSPLRDGLAELRGLEAALRVPNGLPAVDVRCLGCNAASPHHFSEVSSGGVGNVRQAVAE